MKFYEISRLYLDQYYTAIVNAPDAETAAAYFSTVFRGEVIGTRATTEPPKPGQPVYTVPEGWAAPTIETVRLAVEANKSRSAWSRGVKKYASELLDNLDDAIRSGDVSAIAIMDGKSLELALLNGANDWEQYSWGGYSLIYNQDIAERLCSPSELKKTRHGERRPNSREEWLDTQARALTHAFRLISRSVRGWRIE